MDRLTHTDVSTGDVNFESDYIIGPDGNRIGIVEQRNDDYVTWQYEFDELGRLTKELRLDGDFYDEVNEVFLSHVAGDELLSLLKSVLVFKIIDYAFLLVGRSCFCKDDFGFLGLD